MGKIEQKFWTQEEQAIVEDFIKRGIPHNESIRQLHKIFYYRTKQSINLKLSKMKNSDIKKTNPFFYSEETIGSIKKSLETTETIESIAKRISVDINKSYTAVLAKVFKISKDMPGRKKTRFSKAEPVRSLATIRAKKVLQDKKQEEALQQPAEIGVEVPHGMTFEGTPKKIMLHSDHFRIYF
jgi:hypothetical protein